MTHLVSYGTAQSHWRYTDRFHCILTLRHSSYHKLSLQQFNQFLPVFFIAVNSVITLLMTIYFNPCHITWNIKWHCEQNGNRHICSISLKKTKMNKWLQSIQVNGYIHYEGKLTHPPIIVKFRTSCNFPFHISSLQLNTHFNFFPLLSHQTSQQ